MPQISYFLAKSALLKRERSWKTNPPSHLGRHNFFELHQRSFLVDSSPPNPNRTTMNSKSWRREFESSKTPHNVDGNCHSHSFNQHLLSSYRKELTLSQLEFSPNLVLDRIEGTPSNKRMKNLDTSNVVRPWIDLSVTSLYLTYRFEKKIQKDSNSI